MTRWVVAAVLLGILGSVKAFVFRTPVQADAYHKRIAAIAGATAEHFGTWVSVDAPVPEAAVTMLRPNITVSRRYTNVATGESATLLLVQCRDARDIFGHYPPVCYVAHGFRIVESVPRDWQFDGLSIHGMQYTFSSTQPEELTSMIIYDFMILPNGTTCRDMEGVYASARDPRRRRLGAAQMQVLLDASVPLPKRDSTFQSLVQNNRATIDAILDGEMRS
jgi:hypothetical protein